MQLASKVRGSVNRFQTLGHLGTGDRILEGHRIVTDVAALANITSAAGLPEVRIDHTTQETVEDRVGARCLRRIGYYRTQVEVNDNSATPRGRTLESRAYDAGQLPELCLVLAEEINETPLIDRDDARFLGRPVLIIVS